MSDPRGDAPAASKPFTAEQKADIVALLAKFATLDTIRWMGETVLGKNGIAPAADAISVKADYASRLVDLMAQGGRLDDAVGLLRRDSGARSPLIRHLEYVLRGGALDDTAALQSFMSDYQPVFQSGEFGAWYEKLKRTVCAIGVRTPPPDGDEPGLRGTGFLVGPNLVMTNHHVLMDVVEEHGGKLQERVAGSEIYAFFDYLAEPGPIFDPRENHEFGWTAVSAADSWLVHARELMPSDGTANHPAACDNKLDYLVFRLSKKVGSLPRRHGGGAPRGWLELPDQIDVLTERRLFVFQHPQKFPQSFDIGDYVGLDSTQSRTRYRVSAAKGSSGGATVDGDGKLFALHNAEVKNADPPMNQGVRIDLIAKDLEAQKLTDWPPELEKDTGPLQYWSLNDSVTDPKPVIGRMAFRQQAVRLSARDADPPRIIVVSGPEGSGRRFSEKLLRRTVGPDAPIAVLGINELALPAKEFISVIADQLALPDAASAPDPHEGEDKPRWLRGGLPLWLRGRLQAAEGVIPLPAWVVLEAVMPENATVRWGDGVKDLVAALIGVRDPAHPEIPLPDLRWLFIGRENAFPLVGVERFRDDLSVGSDLAGEFAECMQRAWWSVDKQGELSEKALKNMLPVIARMSDKPALIAASNFIRGTIQEAFR